MGMVAGVEVVRVLQVLQVQKEIRGIRAQREIQESPALTEPLGLQEQQEPRVRLELQVLLVPLV